MKLPDVRPAVRALSDDTIAVRRDIHRHAELSTEEHRTQKVIVERLRASGAEDVRPCADTGATALIRGELPGPTILWRADIDALPLQEETGLPFASDGAKTMHACGHDGHVAIALTMARALQQARASLAGTVRFAFQPAEEHVGGAQRMIDDGVMSSPPVDCVFGFHIWAPARVGQAIVTSGPVFAASTHFRVIIRGQGGHASAPHTTVDPIVVSAHAVVALQTVVSRAVNPEETAVLTIGRIQGGVRGNIIPNEVMMSGTIRTFERDVEERVVERATQVLAGVTAAWGATFQFDTSTLPAVVNDPACAALAAGAAATFLGAENVMEGRTTGGDDMAYFLERAPGAYVMLGGWNPERGPAWPHHHPKFDFDERCLDLGVELGLRIIEAATGSSLS